MKEEELGRPELLEVAQESYIDRMIRGKPIWPTRKIEGWEPFRIRPLGYDEEARCHAEARRHLEEELKIDPSRFEDLANNEATVRILYKALITEDSDPDKPRLAKPLARDLDSWKAFPLLTDLNIALLWQEYVDVKLQLSTTFEAVPAEIREKILDMLKKNPNATPHEHWPRAWLMDLIGFLASQASSSTGSNSSTGQTSEPSE